MKPKLSPFLLPLLVLSLLLSLLFSGCQTTPQADKTMVAVVSIQIATSTGASLALANNPDYAPAVRALIPAIDQVLAGNIPITAENIAQFIQAIAVKTNLKPGETLVLTNLATTVYTAYLQAYQPKIVLSSDPQAQLYIKAFRDGLASALGALPPPKTVSTSARSVRSYPSFMAFLRAEPDSFHVEPLALR